MIDIQETAERLQHHVKMLTVTIGERSVYRPENLEKTRIYIESFYRDLGLPVESQTYRYENFEVSNVITQIELAENPSSRFLLGAHYDSVDGTVGADDNAASIAVQLETARYLKNMTGRVKSDVFVKFVSFALEEPPAFTTRLYGKQGLRQKSQERRREARWHDLPGDGGILL